MDVSLIADVLVKEQTQVLTFRVGVCARPRRWLLLLLLRWWLNRCRYWLVDNSSRCLLLLHSGITTRGFRCDVNSGWPDQSLALRRMRQQPGLQLVTVAALLVET